MKFKKVRGVYYGIASNGQIVKFYNKAEMLACARERIEILKLVGNKSEAQACADSLGQCIRRGSVFKMNGMKVILRPKKKIVRITIDPDVEYVGIKKALA